MTTSLSQDRRIKIAGGGDPIFSNNLFKASVFPLYNLFSSLIS
ncbi:hypothetical protein SOVF_176700, partial [Spinacia oleracea]